MDMFYLILGIIFIILGFISIYAYVTKNEKMFWKKQRMIKFYGKTLGIIMHFTGYVIVPIAFGIFLIIKSLD